jgi:hypothetical protein
MSAFVVCLQGVGVLLGMVLLLGGCTTMVDGEKAKPGSGGFRYALPIPILKVVPQPDGTLDTQVMYMPDPEQEYVYGVRSFGASYNLNIEREEDGRLLKKITFGTDASQVASDAINAAGEIAEAQIKADKQRAQEKETADEQRRKDAETARATIRTKELAVAKAKATLDFLLSTAENPPTKQQAAAIRQAELQLKLDQVERDAAIRTARADFGNFFDLAGTDGGSRATSKTSRAYGPVFYRIAMTADSVSLEPVAFLTDGVAGAPSQLAFRSSTAAVPQSDRPSLPAPAPTATPKPRFFFKGSSRIEAQPNGRYLFLLDVAGNTVNAIQERAVTLLRFKDETQPTPSASIPRITLISAGKSVVVDFPATTPPGTYSLQFRYTYGAENKQDVASIPLEIAGSAAP